MNRNKLKGMLCERGLKYVDIARALGVSETTVNSKMNGKTEFTIIEANKLASFLKLSSEEKMKIFFEN